MTNKIEWHIEYTGQLEIGDGDYLFFAGDTAVYAFTEAEARKQFSDLFPGHVLTSIRGRSDV